MDVTYPYSNAKSADIPYLRAVIVSYSPPLRLHYPDISCHPAMLTKTLSV